MDFSFDAIGFWKRMAAESNRIRRLILGGDPQEAYDRVSEIVGRFGCPYVHEMTCTDTEAVLIFTPESDLLLARQIDAFIATAPTLPGWLLYSRRQRKPPEDALRILKEVYEVDAGDARFSVQQAGDKFDVTMHTESREEMNENVAEGYISFFLEHALGEEAAMTKIGHRLVVADLSGARLNPDEFVKQILGEA